MHVAALFDMDGLLIDSEASIMRAWLQVAQRLDAELTPGVYLTLIGRAAPDAFAVLAKVFGGRSRFELARSMVLAELDATPAGARFPLKAGALELLAALAARGIPCAVASSSAREEIDARLTAVGVRQYFAAAAGGDEVARGKPDPAVYQLAASRLGVAPALCVAFEDSHNGARAALAAGARLVLVPDLLQPGDDLRAQALAVLASLAEAPTSIGQWFRAPPGG
ncbi:HAD family hydrolase [Pseudorhodoferax sp.]|uniref:HAD family hydrolase n=1 Tax=Pseudorhodoferax sp. TaxID=1993553 RepID=UPI002DD63C80|nr:HAD family phosphatase [Pseudorhodoferax sp.]